MTDTRKAVSGGGSRVVVLPVNAGGGTRDIVRTMVILNGRKFRSGPCYGTAPEKGNFCYQRCSGARI